jgi:hypothetical protein
MSDNEQPVVTDEEVELALTQRDAALVLQVAEGIRTRHHLMIDQIARGKKRNTNFNKGYIEALADTHNLLNAIVRAVLVPDEIETVSEAETEPEEDQ